MTQELRLSRRQLLQSAGATLALSTLAQPALAQASAPRTAAPVKSAWDGRYFQFVLVADTPVADPLQKPAAASIAAALEGEVGAARLATSVQHIRLFEDRVDFLIHGGNLLQELPYDQLVDYWRFETAMDRAAGELRQLRLPVYLAYGAQDYRTRGLSRAQTHDLFRAKLGVEPFTSFEHHGWRFVVANSFYASAEEGVAQLGQAQLDWLERSLRDGLPTVLALHTLPSTAEDAQTPDADRFYALVEAHRENIAQIFCATWTDAAEFSLGSVPVQAIAAMRHDQDSMVVVRVDTQTRRIDFVNEWGTAFLTAPLPSSLA